MIIKAVSHNGNALEYASDELKNDYNIVMKALSNNGNALQYASDEIRNDRNIVMFAIENSSFALEYASDELQNDREVILHTIDYGELSHLEELADEPKTQGGYPMENIHLRHISLLGITTTAVVNCLHL